MRFTPLLLFVLFCNPSLAIAQKEFGFVNTKPSGQPYWKPDETVNKFKASTGYEVKLFAAEPDLVNPIAFTIDEKGRIWVVENFEYPKRTPKGEKPRDRIKILEDTDGDGKCDKVTIWADGKNLPFGWDLASGIEVGNGGVYLGAAPYLFFLQDTDNDGKCDKQEILLTGFGSEDTHETLNTFQWGPDSNLYGLHGVFTHSNIDGIKMNAAVWRYHPPTKKFEVFAEGTSNPWGMDFDSHGQCHLACCVIPHLFHMVPGGTYKRQAGISFNPFAYGLLKESCDHTHHKESGWAHAGLLVMEGDHVPEAYQGSIIMGSIHGCSIKRDVLHRNGSTFVAKHAPDIVVSGDKNFRPINLRWAPDGSIYMIDWHDQNPCHQAKPDSWDKDHGRIYRIQRTGHKVTPASDVSKKSSQELVALLKNDNPYWYRSALQLLAERKDQKVAPALEKLLFESERETHALRGMWGLYAVSAFDEAIAERALKHKSSWVRAWAVRLAGETGQVSGKLLDKFAALAKAEPEPEVRLQLASTAQRLKKQDVLPMLHNLMTHKKDVSDPFIPLMLWLAYEPRVPAQQSPTLEWLKENAPGNPLVSAEIVPKTMRRLIATGKAEDLEACLGFIAAVHDSEVRRHALDGMLTALKNQKKKPPDSWRDVATALSKDKDSKVQEMARKLAVHFQDAEALQQALKIAQNVKLKSAERIDALRDLALADTWGAVQGVLDIVAAKADNAEVRAEALRTLGHFDNDKVPQTVVSAWATFTPQLKVEAVNLLTTRKTWAVTLLDAVGAKKIAAADLHNNQILKIHAFKDAKLNQQVEKVWGKLRDTPAELDKLITKMRGELDQAPASFTRGKKVFENNCAKCHKFDGIGHEVGPNLDGAARDIEYLLGNILDPNRVVGAPYFTRLVQLKDGRIETGLLHAEDPMSITLKGENSALKVILKKDIDGDILVQPKSVMPEGLDKNMTVQDLRDLLRYLMVDPFVTELFVTEAFPAGKEPKVSLAKPLASQGVPWKAHPTPVTGKVALSAGSEPTVRFIAGRLVAPMALKTDLRVGANQTLRIWVNGKVVYSGKPAPTEVSPDQVSVPVSLQQGENHLLIEATGAGPTALFIRFQDRDRQLAQVTTGE